MDLAFTLKELVGILEDVAVDGEFDGCISGIASLSEAVSGDVSFLGNLKYRSEVKGCRASVIFLPVDFAGTPSKDKSISAPKTHHSPWRSHTNDRA